ncbi:MAG: DUF1993 domain-containing protein [Sphingobium sp.]|nr:DUF1993 domain-containing protein [Sphingobium sp.]
MPISMYDASIPMLINMLGNMKVWLDKAAAQKSEADLIDARLIADMRPLTAQFQSASDSAKNGAARLAGIEMPSMPDTETSFAELKERCDKTVAFLQTITPEQLEGSENRTVEIRFPSGHGYRFTGLDYLTKFMLPNFFFHVQTAYAILRAQGVDVGKQDYLQHMGMPNIMPEPA